MSTHLASSTLRTSRYIWLMIVLLRCSVTAKIRLRNTTFVVAALTFLFLSHSNHQPSQMMQRRQAYTSLIRLALGLKTYNFFHRCWIRCTCNLDSSLCRVVGFLRGSAADDNCLTVGQSSRRTDTVMRRWVFLDGLPFTYQLTPMLLNFVEQSTEPA